MKYILAHLLIFALFSISHAGNFTVNNVTQFQTALNTAATNGENDTINVLGGTYNVNPTLSYSTTQNFSILIKGSGSPVLDGGNLRQIMQLASNSANGGIFIEGLTIQHGRADYGGGLNVSTTGGDISVKNCTVNDNTANFVAGGINLFSNTGNITVTGCSFSRNSSPNTSGYPYGTAGGLFIQTDGAGTTIKLAGCFFQLNTAQRDAAGAMLYPLGSNSIVITEYNTFSSNTAKEAGGGCWIRGPGSNTSVRYGNNTLTGNSSSIAGNGGGTYIQIASGTIDVFDNIYNGNNASWQGGGLWIEHSGGTLNILRNRFTNSTSGESGGGANVFLDYGVVNVDHNVFSKNRTSGTGGGLNLSTTTGRVNLFNNTFYLNTAVDGGDVNIYFDNSSSSCYFYNNILYNSSLPALSYSGQQTVIARYSDIKGGIGQPWYGTGCIDKFPFFADTAGGDFHLQDSIHCGDQRYSPCIDAGDPAVLDRILNCDWGLGTNRSDMGAYGGKDSITIGINKQYANIPEYYLLHQNYPNPFNPYTKIKFSLPAVGEMHAFHTTKLIIYDALGREVTTLVNEGLSPGTYEVEWDASNNPSGVYFYKLITADYSETRKMVLIK
jgi:hypothetical protein